jgi:hypothetical protein
VRVLRPGREIGDENRTLVALDEERESEKRRTSTAEGMIMTTHDRERNLPGTSGNHRAKRVEEEHDALRSRLDSVAAATSRSELLEGLRPLPKMLLEHFAFEEQADGLFDDLQARSPIAAPKLAALHDDHRVIIDELDALRRSLQSPADPEEKISATAMRELARWLEKLRHHESTESRIVADIYYTDEGGHG